MQCPLKQNWSSVSFFYFKLKCFFKKIYVFILIGGHSFHNTMEALPYIDESPRGTRVPHPEPLTALPTPCLWVVPEHCFECLASCIQLALVICFTYGSIHVSMLFSCIIPPLPSLFCCLAYWVTVTVFINSIYMC